MDNAAHYYNNPLNKVNLTVRRTHNSTQPEMAIILSASHHNNNHVTLLLKEGLEHGFLFLLLSMLLCNYKSNKSNHIIIVFIK